MRVLQIWSFLHFLFTVRCVHWSLNSVFNVTQTAVHSSNLTDCFVCVAGPAHIGQGFPLEADPLHPAAWLAVDAATLKTGRLETSTPFETTVSHAAALCYESKQGSISLGAYSRCAVTVDIRRGGAQERNLSSHLPVGACRNDSNATLWQRIPVTPGLWVSSYGVLSGENDTCSGREPGQVQDNNRTLVSVLLASMRPQTGGEKRTVLTTAGWFFLCGTFAYKYLPYNWSGICTLGTLRPALEVIFLPRRQKRDDNPLVIRNSHWYRFLRAMVPTFGVLDLEKALVNISTALEKLANHTAHGMSVLQDEVKSVAAFSYQNRLGIDFLLIKSGGLCRTLNISCCFLIDRSGEISRDIAEIRKQAALFHEIGLDHGSNSSFSFGDLTKWLGELFGDSWSGWIMRVFVAIIAFCLLAVICKACIVLCLNRMCTSGKSRVHLYPVETDDPDEEFNRLGSIVMDEGDPDEWDEGIDTSSVSSRDSQLSLGGLSGPAGSV